MDNERLQARRVVLKAVNEHRVRFNHYLLSNSNAGFTIPMLSMAQIQTAVSVARRWNLVGHKTLERAGYKGMERTGKGWL